MLKYIYSNDVSELAADNNENIRIEGAVKESAGGIPFDYKEKYSKYFTKEYFREMSNVGTSRLDDYDRGDQFGDLSPWQGQHH